MNTRFIALASALVASGVFGSAPSLADSYSTGATYTAPALGDTYPASATFAAAADWGASYFSDPSVVSLLTTTDLPNTLVSIAVADYSGSVNYSAAARTAVGSNHAHAQSSGFSSGVYSVNSYSGWYDQITIGGGTGTGTLQFSVQLTGSVAAGAYLGTTGFSLLASPVHPQQLASDMLVFNTLTTQPWGLYGSQVQTVSAYSIIASPYNDPDIITGLFSASAGGDSGIPVLNSDPTLQLGAEDGMGFPEFSPDLIVTPGNPHLVNVTLTGTVDFAYGEAFYLIGALGTQATGSLENFCDFGIGDETCVTPPVDGTGATTLDFLNSALLAGIVLPEGATFASASGAAYNVTAVPEPGEWAMLLAGLGLVAWRTRRKKA